MSSEFDKENIANILLEIHAVLLKPNNPFRFTSGILSPIYCDNRLIISHPDIRNTIIGAFIHTIQSKSIIADTIAGTATAGIPHAAWIADRLHLPMIYVRGKPKNHGRSNQIEGSLNQGSHIVMIEDLISTGGSVIEAIKACREAGGIVQHALAIFTYNLPTTADEISHHDFTCHTLCDLRTLLDVALEKKHINQTQYESIEQWQQDPQNWEKNAGLEK